jgi:hypothetical protein
MAVKAAIERCLSSLSSELNSKIYLNINLLRCARELRINLDTCRFTFEDKYDVPILSSIIYKYAEKIRMQDVSSNPSNGLSPLSTSQKDDLVGLLGEAIKGGASLTTTDEAGYTALHYVAKWISNKDITSMMVNANRPTLDANQNGDCVTPLVEAILAGNEIVAEELIKLGADLTIKSFGGYRPIDTAIVYQASNSIISAIASNQIDFRAYKNSYNLTPLLWAISLGHFEQANVLLMWSDQTITAEQQFPFMHKCVIGCFPDMTWSFETRSQPLGDVNAFKKLKFCVDHLDDPKSFKEAIRFFMTELKTTSTRDAVLQSRSAAAQRRLDTFFKDYPDYKPTD